MMRISSLAACLLALALSTSGLARAEVLAPPPDETHPDEDAFTPIQPDDDIAPPPPQTSQPEPVAPPPPQPPPPQPTHTHTGTATVAPAADPHASVARQAPADEDVDAESDEHREWFWIEAGAGYSWINLVQMRDEGLTGEPDLLQGSGFIFEGGLGFEVSILQIGVTSSYASYEHFDVVTAELDATLVIPIPVIEPFIRVGVGYAHMGRVEVATMGGMPQKARIRGIGVDVGAGLDIHLSDAFQLGFAFDASIINLQRQKVTELGTITNVDFTRTGNAIGLQLNGTARITFQF